MTNEIKGPYGIAWPFDMAILSKDTALISAFCVKVPWANMIWDSYVVAMMHLRPIPRMKNPEIRLQGATHEVMVFAMNPDWKFDPARDFIDGILQPTNFVGQFIAASDAEAAAKVEQCVIDIVNGDLSPDTDYTQHWIARFSASNIKGDPATAGQTIINLDGNRKLTFDPVALTKKPKDVLCRLCGQPAVATHVIGDDVCLRCAQAKKIFNPARSSLYRLFQ